MLTPLRGKLATPLSGRRKFATIGHDRRAKERPAFAALPFGISVLAQPEKWQQKWQEPDFAEIEGEQR